MTPDQVKALFEERGLRPAPVHIDATAAVVSALVKGSAERFGALGFEAEPSGYVGELKRRCTS